AYLADAFHKVSRATVAQIVAVDRRDHHVRQLHGGNASRQVYWLVDVEWIGPAVTDITERAATGALVAHDHERGRTLAEALADVRTRRLFADCMQVVFAQNALDIVKARARRRGPDANPVGLLQALGLYHLDWNTRGLF